MLYTRFGTEVKVVGNCGEHKPHGFNYPITLLKIRFDFGADGQKDGYQFAEALKADEGWQAIDAALKAAPQLILHGDELDRAIQDAL